MRELGSKEKQGMDPFYTEALAKNTAFHHAILTGLGHDATNVIRHAMQHGGVPSASSGALDQRNIPTGRTLASVLIPHKVIDVTAKRNEYISTVTTEYGISPADFAAGTMRFKVDQSTANARFIEQSRTRRGILNSFLYDILALKNDNNLRSHLQRSLEVYTRRTAIVNVAKQKLTELIESSSLASLSHVPEAMAGEPLPESMQPQAPSESADGSATSKQPSASGSGAAQETHEEPAMTAMAMLPEKLQGMLRWHTQLKSSYEHLFSMRRALADLVDSPQPVQIRWTSPLVTDRLELITASEVLQYSDAKKAELWQHHYAISS